jgi:23S rRNA (adenine2503-C2)-methyltransferase
MVDSLLDLAPGEAAARLRTWVSCQGLPDYRADQLVRRLWRQPVARWSDATELPITLRTRLDREQRLLRLPADRVEVSTDGTKKFLWRLADGQAVESVLIPSGSRRTLCLSSQAGCALGCTFCATGKMGFRRQLTPGEIAGQAREVILANPADRPTNVVFMGMGEPLLNWPAVDVALTILNDSLGLGIGARHVTVSTVGILPAMELLRARPEQFRLAISLHATASPERLGLMPIERKYPLDAVLAAAGRFGRRVTFEYVMIAGRNDRDEDADRLAAMARRLGAHVNLLPLHPGGADPTLRASSGNRIRAFAGRLRGQGVEAVVRRSRGLDIHAACGQLFVATERQRRPVSEALDRA